MITIALTTFNRSDIVGRAVDSALNFAAMIDGKVVLADDGSTDQTEATIRRDFPRALSDGTLSYVRHETNLGVTAAKNTAFIHSPAGWVIFLDSDDELISESAPEVARILVEHKNTALVFFRCVDETGAAVGRQFKEAQQLTLRRYLSNTSYGEALTAINKTISPSLPYDSDLRGYEGLGCARLIERFGPALLSTVVVRRYDRTRNDRLSGFIGVLKRSDLLARGHRRYLALYKNKMLKGTRATLQIKSLVYSVAAGLFGRWMSK